MDECVCTMMNLHEISKSQQRILRWIESSNQVISEIPKLMAEREELLEEISNLEAEIQTNEAELKEATQTDSESLAELISKIIQEPVSSEDVQNLRDEINNIRQGWTPRAESLRSIADSLRADLLATEKLKKELVALQKTNQDLERRYNSLNKTETEPLPKATLVNQTQALRSAWENETGSSTIFYSRIYGWAISLKHDFDSIHGEWE